MAKRKKFVKYGMGREPSPPDPRDYKMRTALAVMEVLGLKPKEWDVGTTFDQGDSQHCVGFSWAGWGVCTPVVDDWVDADGHRIYYEAKVIDGEPEAESGSYVRSGAKALKDDGRVGVYFFADSVDEAAEYVSQYGPVVLGIEWSNNMFEPDSDGVIKPGGGVAGGHAILWYGISEDYALLRNSWGSEWGIDGDCMILLEDLEKAFKNDGEACAAAELPLAAPEPIKRKCWLARWLTGA